MCDFCQNIEEYGIKEPYLDIDGELLYNSKENKHYIVLHDVWNDYFYEKEVEFCPMCGRKLSNETEKPNTDEIIAKLKENLTEDEQKKLDESIKSFADGVNGLWEVVRKGIENG